MNREPNALDALANVAVAIAEIAAWIIIFAAPAIGWIMTPAGMQ